MNKKELVNMIQEVISEFHKFKENDPLSIVGKVVDEADGTSGVNETSPSEQMEKRGMKKSELKETIQKIVLRKLTENTSAESDPRLQLPGYGNMPLSYWKKSVTKRIEELLQIVKDENYKGAAYIIKDNNVLSNVLKMLVEHEAKNLSEVDVPLPAPVAQTEPNLSDMDKKTLQDLQVQTQRVSDDIKKIDGSIAKIREKVEPQIHRLEKEKSKRQKKLASLIDKTQGIQGKK
jgi:hypothetical protein